MPRYAIIEESGGQRKVAEGDNILIDLYQGGESKADDSITFENVLAISDDTGASTPQIGTPYVGGASVTAKIVEPMIKGEKLYIYKFKPKKGYRRKTGHRQRFTGVTITSITG